MANVRLRFGIDAAQADGEPDWTIDCTGYAARSQLSGLRGVKGEMLVLAAPDLNFSRPIRLLHPRHPVYIVPREENRFMIGATQIENEERARVTARSIVDLINSAYAVHPAFGEAEIAETGSDLRPAFSDNLPRIILRGRSMSINGLFRHGFLLAPALARHAADYAFQGITAPDVMRPSDASLRG
jgi:glycine oxidase